MAVEQSIVWCGEVPLDPFCGATARIVRIVKTGPVSRDVIHKIEHRVVDAMGDPAWVPVDEDDHQALGAVARAVFATLPMEIK